MPIDDFAGLDATAQALLVRSGKASSRELVEAAIERIERLNPALNAVIHERFEKARQEAAAPHSGPFRGVPTLAKDISCQTAGDPFSCGMRFLRDRGWTEPDDAFIATRLRDAGFVFVGRTNTPELGLMPTTEPVAFGPTRNPWDVTRSPGGSSGGAAAAVASRMVPLAHATDSGGSIRIPSSACALVGLKPSRGLLVDEGSTLGGLNVQHVVTRSVRDTAALLDVLAASTPVRPFTEAVAAEPERLRVGLMTKVPGGLTPVHPDCVAAAEDAATLMESLGHAVDRSHPAALDEIEHIIHYGAITGADTAAKLDFWSDRTGERIGGEDVEPGTWALAEMGRTITREQLRDSLAWCARYAPRMAAWWDEGFDLLLTPTLAEPPPPLGELVSTREAPLSAALRAGAIVPFTPPFNTTGQPAISLPLHWNDAGLPIGIQLVAAARRDDLLVRVAAQLERARSWSDRRPPASA